MHIYSVKVSENSLKWLMRIYPPMLFQRIWVQKFEKDFKGVRVKIHKSLLNQNYNKSIFGGTIFSAADPFYPVLFDQIFKAKGYQVRVWLKSAAIQYIKPGRGHLYFHIHLSDEEISNAENILKSNGKFVKSFPIQFFNAQGELCAESKNEVYVRNLFPEETPRIAY